MPINSQETAYSATFSVDDLEAALRLLSAEERAGRTNWHKLAISLALHISFGVALVAIPIGFLLILFDQMLGWRLLVLAAIAALIFIIFNIRWGEVATEPDDIRATLSESLSRTTKAAWEKRVETYDTENIIIVLLFLPFLSGLGWLIYRLGTAGEVSLPSLALIGLPVLIFWMLVALRNYRESEYMLQVSRLRDKLESRLQEVSETGSSEVPLSSKEISLLSQAETRAEMQQVEDKVAQVKHERPDELLYSIAIALEPLKYLNSLAEREPEVSIAIREAWDDLQTEPKPIESHLTQGSENEFVIRRGQYDIIYLVDDQKHRIDVVKIQEITQEKNQHVS